MLKIIPEIKASFLYLPFADRPENDIIVGKYLKRAARESRNSKTNKIIKLETSKTILYKSAWGFTEMSALKNN
jgi:hypothetical protein